MGFVRDTADEFQIRPTPGRVPGLRFWRRSQTRTDSILTFVSDNRTHAGTGAPSRLRHPSARCTRSDVPQPARLTERDASPFMAD